MFIEHTDEMVEQIIRPTGLLDPIVEVRPSENQIDDLMAEINERIERNERVLITTLTKKMSEVCNFISIHNNFTFIITCSSTNRLNQRTL